MNIRIKTVLLFPEIDHHTARTLLRALEPDNSSVPSNIIINSVVEEKILKILIELIGRPKDILTLRNTIDDLLEHLNIALKVVESVKDN